MIEQFFHADGFKERDEMTLLEQRPHLGIGNIQIDACAQIATRTTYQQYELFQ